MRHPSEGVLRRLLDEPARVADVDREHVAGCRQCLEVLAEMRDDVAVVAAALDIRAAHEVDVTAAWERFTTAPPTPVASPPSTDPRRRLLGRPAVAAVAVAVAMGGAGAAAANDWLPVFKAEQVAPVSVTSEDLVTLPDLSAYGDVAVAEEPDVRAVPDAAAAAAQTGLDVPEVAALPDGVTGGPVVQVGDRVTGTFTFSAEQAARAAAAAGEEAPPVPAGLDGSVVRLVAGPGVAQVWRSSAGAPALLVGRAVAPEAHSSGVPVEVVRDYVLSLPGVPDELAAQLRGFTGDGTMPLPVPADRVTTSEAQVDGAEATVLVTRDRSMSAVVWVDGGLLTVVAGSLDADEVLTVARDLR